MQIELKNIGKRYRNDWVFKDLDFVFEENSSTAIIGSNGSGKSTLLKIISAAELPTSGSIIYQDEARLVKADVIYSRMNYTGPYVDVAEQLTTLELINFHLKFKPFIHEIDIDQFLQYIFLEDSKNKYVKDFSSGMKQRLKLGLAICTACDILLLDEPCSNLDSKGVEMYQELIQKFNGNRLTIIGSNEQKDEIFNVQQSINIMDFKPKN